MTESEKNKILQDTQAHIDRMREESRKEGAFVHACLATINNRRLATCESNRQIFESLLNAGEEPSSKLYVALAEQYPHRFAWEPTHAKPSAEEHRKEFNRYVRENNLSSCDANFTLFKKGAALENFAPASQEEANAYSHEYALQRNRWLRTEASPLELRAEARYEAEAQSAASRQAQADATLQAQKQHD